MPRGRWQASVCLFLYSTETFAMKPQNPKPYLLACAALALGSVQAADLQEPAPKQDQETAMLAGATARSWAAAWSARMRAT
ncbi:O-methyltransferase domain protein [Alicycliphilus sp. B1]|nr:O-methyltransferase domain protein [Alicycliphilus sp. B1]